MSRLLSIVVPVYNAAGFLVSCVDTLRRQGLAEDDFEIILVDDGSNDGSAEMCDKLAKGAQNIQVIHQRNQGAGVARNVGMDAACGDYVYFFDVDDALVDGALGVLINRCVNEDLDVLFFSACIVYENDEARKLSRVDPAYCTRLQKPGVVTGEEMFVKQQEVGNYCAQPCTMMTRLAFVRDKDVRFAEGIINEDNLFVLLATLRAERADVDPSFYYTYHVRGSSVTTSNHNGYNRFIAHIVLAQSFERERRQAAEAEKTELAKRISELVNFFIEIARDAFVSLEGDVGSVDVGDALWQTIVDQLFRPLRDARIESQRLEHKVDEMRESTGWKVGRAITAAPRAVKRVIQERR